MQGARLSLVVIAALFAGAVRADAQPLPPDVVPDQYELRFAFDLEHDAFTGAEQILVNVEKPTAHITLNAGGLSLKQATIVSGWSSQPATVTLDAGRERATLTVRRRLLAGPARIRIEYSGRLGTAPRGLFTGVTNGRKWVASQFESSDARHAFPCFDQPDMKASFLITVVAPARDMVISNGRVLTDTPGPGENEHTVRFATTRKMSTYLAAIAVGDFACLESRAGDVPLRVCALRGQEPRAAFAVEASAAFLGFYERYFTAKYPFGKLDLVAIPGFPGGMENVGAIFFGERDLLVDPGAAPVESQKSVAVTIAHEIAHQWLGDLVTMKWWDDLWMKEGFATFFETKPILTWKPEWHAELDEVASAEQAMGYDGLDITRPARSRVTTPAEIDDSYDAIAYQKAGAVLRMVEAAMGPEVFRQNLNAFIKRFAYANATAEDLWASLAENNARDVDTILHAFIDQPGVPIVSVAARCLNDATSTLSLGQQRFWTDARHAPGRSPAWAIPVSTRPVAPQAGVPPLSITRLLTGKDQSFDLAGCSATVLGNARATGYFRTSYSREVLARLAAGAESQLTPAERLRLLDDQWAITFGGGEDIADYLSLVSHYSTDRNAQVVERIGETLRTVAENLTTGTTREAFGAWVRGVFGPRTGEPALPADDGNEVARGELAARTEYLLGSVGRDPDTLARARAAVMGEDASADPALGAVMTRLAAEVGDAAVFARIIAAIEGAKSTEAYERNATALGDFTRPELVGRALQYALSEHVRGADAARIAGAAVENPEARTVAWPFVKAHWRELLAKSGTDEAGTAILTATASFCDAASRDDVRTFLGERGLGASRALAQTLDRIQSCIDFKAAQQANLQRWLAAATSSR